jgi:hypothetical protein
MGAPGAWLNHLRIGTLVFWVTAITIFGSTDLTDAAQNTVSHQVTVNVPKVSEFYSDLDSFTLSFSDYLAGSESNAQAVNYTIRTNDLQRTSGVVQVKANGVLSAIHLKADTGVFVKSAGNARLVESSPGFVALNDDWTSLCDREAESGSGQIVDGSIPVTYQAFAQEDLDAGNISIQLEVILVDS